MRCFYCCPQNASPESFRAGLPVPFLFTEGLEIYAFIFLSNHWHMLCKDNKGTLAAFMCYFQANVAKAINRELGRRGRFWSREYDDVIVDGDDEFWNRYAYTVGNAVKAGLVDEARHWIGGCSLDAALSNSEFCFEMTNRTRLHNATRRGQKVDPSKFIETWSFELSTPPMMADKSTAEIKNKIKETLKSAEEEYRGARENKPPLGVAKVLRQNPTDRPKNPSFRPRIRVFSLDKDRRKALLDGYRTFVGGYKKTLEDYRKAAAKRTDSKTEWPHGSYPPSCWHPIGYEEAA
jgi:hypothetical protein